MRLPAKRKVNGLCMGGGAAAAQVRPPSVVRSKLALCADKAQPLKASAKTTRLSRVRKPVLPWAQFAPPSSLRQVRPFSPTAQARTASRKKMSCTSDPSGWGLCQHHPAPLGWLQANAA
jgi:hypothetical protein